MPEQDLFGGSQTEKSMVLDEKTIQQIARYTQRNDHTEALIKAAKALGQKTILERLKVIQRDQERRGELTIELYHNRFNLMGELFTFARAKLSPENFQQLYSVF